VLRFGFCGAQFTALRELDRTEYLLRLDRAALSVLGLSLPPGNRSVTVFGDPDAALRSRSQPYAHMTIRTVLFWLRQAGSSFSEAMTPARMASRTAFALVDAVDRAGWRRSAAGAGPRAFDGPVVSEAGSVVWAAMSWQLVEPLAAGVRPRPVRSPAAWWRKER
jgi:hypothetical protein